MTIQHGAIVRVYTAHDGCITGWNDSQWMGKTSSASCTKPRHLDTCDGQSGATVVKKLTGTLFKGRFVRVGEGVTVEPRG
jgi:hypothetical protein